MANRGGDDSISEWFRQVPIVTKILAFGTLLSGCLVSFKILPAVSLLLYLFILLFIILILIFILIIIIHI